MKAILQIENVQEVVPALKVKSVFSQRGGILGSAEGVTWQIQDIEGSIAENAARIVVVDDKFTIESLSRMNIHINGAKAPIAPERPVILSDKDTLEFGTLKCRVSIGNEGTHSQSKISSMSSFALEEGDMQDALVIDGEFTEASTDQQHKADKRVRDPLDALNAETEHSNSVDPIAALDDSKTHFSGKEANALNSEISHEERDDNMTTLPDETYSARASMQPSKIQRDRYGFEEVNDTYDNPQSSVDSAKIDLDHSVDHVALRPLSRALGLPMGDMSSTQAAQALTDIGGALRAAVGGINHIYNSRGATSNRFPLTTLHLHAVEDNPLRFSTDTDEALHALFAKRGAVHLSAPAAMQEAMEHFDAHQVATEKAIDKALDSVLKALLPRALEKRFRSYAPSENPKDGEERDAWCWGMYKAYFSELKSQRQKGLQMLFWEVFQHEYQGIMRSHELTVEFEGEDE